MEDFKLFTPFLKTMCIIVALIVGAVVNLVTFSSKDNTEYYRTHGHFDTFAIAVVNMVMIGIAVFLVLAICIVLIRFFMRLFMKIGARLARSTQG